MVQGVLKLLLLLIHLLYSCIITVQTKCSAAFKNFRTMYETIALFENPIITRSDNEKIVEHLQVTPKIPEHLVIIIGNESVSYCDLVKLITWSLLCGIASISFYDHKNVLNSYQLFKAVVKYNGDIISLIKWGSAFNGSVRSHSKQLINGFQWTPKIGVSVFQKEDGKSLFVDAAVKLCSNVSDISSINESVIDKCIKSTFSSPEPDLAIICGDTCSSFGLQPWLLRVTEFLVLPSHHNICIDDFIRILHKYGAVEQRFGK